MTALVKMTYSDVDLDAVAALGGLIAIFVGADGKLHQDLYYRPFHLASRHKLRNNLHTLLLTRPWHLA